MEEAKEDVRADIAVMRRAAEKADTEVAKAETEKKKQVKCIKLHLELSVPHIRAGNNGCMVAGQDDR